MRVELFGDNFRVLAATRRYAKRPRLGVVIVPAGGRPPLRLGPWLQARYGVEQLQRISLTGVEWDGLASGPESSAAAERLRDRLTLALLCRPELVVVAGSPAVDTVRHGGPRSRQDVERIAERIRSWNLPVAVVGMWVEERSNAEARLMRSEEGERHEPAEVSVLGAGVSAQWLAESVWETEGGRLKETREPAVATKRRPTHRSTRPAGSDDGGRPAGDSNVGRRAPSRRAVGGLPRLRSHPAWLTRA